MIFRNVNGSVARAGAGIALVLVLAACGGAAPVAKGIAGSPKVPAGTLLSMEDGKKVLKGVKPIPVESPTAPVQPTQTATAIASRTPGPAGNPIAATLADPASPGLWAHEITISGTAFPRTTFEFDVEVHAAKLIAGARRQEFEWKIEQAPQRFIYDWTDQQLLLVELHTTNPDGTKTDCTLEPPAAQVKLPLNVGATWTTDSKCEGEGIEQTFEVIRTERLTVDGTPVETFVIEQVSSERTDQCGKVTTTQTSWYAPALRMFARADTMVETARNTPQCGTFQTNIDLLEVSPRPAGE